MCHAFGDNSSSAAINFQKLLRQVQLIVPAFQDGMWLACSYADLVEATTAAVDTCLQQPYPVWDALLCISLSNTV